MTNTSYHTVKLSVLGTCKLIQMSIHSNTNAFHPILGVSSGNYQGTVPTIQFYFIKDGCFPLANMTFGNSGESVGTTLIHRFNYRPYCNLTMDSPTMQLDHSHHHSIWQSTMNYHGRPSNTMVTMVIIWPGSELGKCVVSRVTKHNGTDQLTWTKLNFQELLK